jgi:hypothetical protein
MRDEMAGGSPAPNESERYLIQRCRFLQVPVNEGVRCAIGPCKDGRRGICRACIGERGCAEDEEIGKLPVLEVWIHDAAVGGLGP